MTLYWDFDGTLVHAESLWTNCTLEALRTILPYTSVTQAELCPHMAWGFPWHTPEKDHTASTSSRWWKHMNEHFFRAYLALGVDAQSARAASSLVRSLILQPERYTVDPDCHTVLQQALDHGFRNILLSNNHPDLKLLMEQLDLTKYFSHFVVSGEIGYDKPRPEIFALACSYDPKETERVMIGDSLSADIQGAKAAGMRAVLVHKSLSEAADASIPSLSELFSALSALFPPASHSL